MLLKNSNLKLPTHCTISGLKLTFTRRIAGDLVQEEVVTKLLTRERPSSPGSCKSFVFGISFIRSNENFKIRQRVQQR